MNVEPIEITAADGVLLRGQHWRGGDSWALLFHEAERDLDCWHPILLPLVSHGFSVLTLDMRGHGATDGEWNTASLGGDLEAAIRFAQNNGASSIAMIGAGQSVLPSLMKSHSQNLFAIVALSPGPLGDLTPDELRGDGVPKLLIVGSLGESAVEAVEQIRDKAIGWLVVMRLPTAEQGTTLLSGQWGKHIEEQTIAFLEEHRYLKDSHPRPDWNPSAGEVLFKRLFGG
jgi:hypothetical protein